MEKVSFRLVAAFQVFDCLTKKQLNSLLIDCDMDLKRQKKEGGINVLAETLHTMPVEERLITVSSPTYQPAKFHPDPAVDRQKIWLVPDKSHKLSSLLAAVTGMAAPESEVSLTLKGKDTGMKVMELTGEGRIGLARAGKNDPEGGRFLLTDGKNSAEILLSDFLEEIDGIRYFRFETKDALPEAKEAKLYSMMKSVTDASGRYYLPIGVAADETEAVVASLKDGKKQEKAIKLSAGKCVEEDLL